MLSFKISSFVGIGALLGVAYLNGAHAASGKITLYLAPTPGSGDGPCSGFWEFGTYDANKDFDDVKKFNAGNGIRYYQIHDVDGDSAEACERLENHQDASTIAYNLYTGDCSQANGKLYGGCKNTECVEIPEDPVCLHIETALCQIGSTGAC
jgi:hypothetical protein